MPLQIRRLQEDDLRAQFDCGDESLNEYLRRYAWQNQQRHRVGVTYVAVEAEQPRLILGYYTLAASKIARAELPETARRLSPYGDVPVILLGRLAVDRRFAGRGLGEALLGNALKKCMLIGTQIGCRCILVEAYRRAVPWYQRYGFVPIAAPPGSPTVKMFLDLHTVQGASEASGESAR